MRLVRRLAASAALFLLAACTTQAERAALLAEKRAARFATESPAPDCAGVDGRKYSLGAAGFRFPASMQPARTGGGVTMSFVSDDGPEKFTLLAPHMGNDDADMVRFHIPALKEYRFDGKGQAPNVFYNRRPDRVHETGLSLVSPGTPTGAPHDLFFADISGVEVATLIHCPVNPTAIAPMHWCTLHGNDDRADLGYQVEFLAADLKLWRLIDDRARTIIADAKACGRS
ncbi:hypothetical protein A8950_2119 [Dongia mobilis]|uniref:Lipoprotein n=1 Tax=Dongia mobilis TaxID=578943 RepID=A0A4R6WRV9_9PROT|nr:hypothetical protein A8950_2119 [Dongia mobilis]